MQALSDPLAGMRDIHLPPDPAWWPPAPGWWVLALLVLAVAVATRLVLRRITRRRRVRSSIMRAFGRIHSSYQRGEESRRVAADVAVLLKRVALARFPREQVAGLGGEAWFAFLGDTSAGDPFWSASVGEYARLVYHSEARADLEPLLGASHRWLKANS